MKMQPEPVGTMPHAGRGAGLGDSAFPPISSERPVSSKEERAEIQEGIVEFIPSLRAFARSLTSNAGEADDLLQETLLRAIANVHQFRPGTNLKAWLFRIQRNVYYTSYRKRRRETSLLPEQAEQIVAAPQQEWSIKIKAMHQALERLPEDQREALLLVSGAGLSYEEAAELCGCALGTIKSRVSRARTRLLVLLNVEDHVDFLQVDHPQP